MEQQNNNWYILSVVKGRENKIIEKINLELKINKIEDKVKELKQINNKKMLKGIIFCQIKINSDLVKIFYSVPGVIGFLNHNKTINKLPEFVSDETIEQFFQELKKEKEEKEDVYDEDTKISRPKEEIILGDIVKIIDGPFTSYEGKITKINEKKEEISIELEKDGKNNLVENILLEKLPISNCLKIR